MWLKSSTRHEGWESSQVVGSTSVDIISGILALSCGARSSSTTQRESMDKTLR